MIVMELALRFISIYFLSLSRYRDFALGLEFQVLDTVKVKEICPIVATE